MLHVHFHLRACVCVDVARSHVKHLLRRELQGKKIQHRTYKLFFCSKHFFGKPCIVQEKGLRQKSP